MMFIVGSIGKSVDRKYELMQNEYQAKHKRVKNLGDPSRKLERNATHFKCSELHLIGIEKPFLISVVMQGSIE